MALEWDVLLDSVSIRDEISEFQIRIGETSYTRELTLFSVDPDFFDSFDYTKLPSLQIEVKTKLDSTWVSQGFFFIEKPTYALTSKSKLSRGVWGRSETAKAGEPFAEKVTKTWDETTTIQAIINEMATLVGLSVSFDIDDYPIYANTYSVDLAYPIDVISDLCTFAGAFVSCDAAGNLLIKKKIYHTTSEDYTVDDNDIRSLTEKITYPDFGNRIKVSSFSSNAGYAIELSPLGNSDCLPADGVSELVVLAFVSLDNEPVEDNILVSWECETGITLEKTESPTQSYLLSNLPHEASSYNTVEVDYPIEDIIGIWAYSDTKRETNYWNSNLANCSFDGKEITVHNPFVYCDQALLISYITTGVAVNTITAGSTAVDSVVTASLDGAEGELEIAVGNICACGTQMNVRRIPDSQICWGNKANLLVWAELGNEPAVGFIAKFTLEGCGSLSSTRKTLGKVSILNEKANVYNTISGVSQVNTEIHPASTATPEVYLLTDTAKATDLYSSHSDKVIDLNTVLANGTEVYIDYTGNGCAAISWLNRDLTLDDAGCDADITVQIADGSETGLEETVTFTLQDCSTEAEADSGLEEDALSNNYSSADDPDDIDNDTEDGGLNDCEGHCGDLEGAEKTACIENCESGAVLTECDVMMLNIYGNIENVSDDQKDATRFGVGAGNECPATEGDYACDCSHVCEREMVNRGNTFDHDETVHDQALAYGDAGSPEYNEAYNSIRSANLATCEEDCNDTRNSECGCNISGPATLSPGESAEYVCSDGTVGLITMPVDGCGTHTFTLGCCEFEVRSTDGYWELASTWSQVNGCSSGPSSYCYPYSLTTSYCSYDLIEGSVRYVGQNAVFYTNNNCGDCDCQPEPRAGSCIASRPSVCGSSPSLGCNNPFCVIKPRMESMYNWACNP